MLSPLNGTVTHPLSAVAIDTLRLLAEQPLPRQEINAGIVNRLQREALIEQFQGRSPYVTHRDGRQITWIRATPAGKAMVAG